jgi:hypothetical protein
VRSRLLGRGALPARVKRTCSPASSDRLKPCIALVANDRPLPCLPMERRWKARKERERPGASNIQQHAKDRRRPSREKTRRSPRKKAAGRKEVECRESGKQERERQHTRNGDRQETKSEHGADLPRVNCQSAKPSTEPFRTLSRIVMGLCQAWLPERPHTLMVEAQLPEVTSPHGCDAQLGNRNPPSCCAAQPVEPSYTLVHSDGPPPQYSSSFLKSAATAPVTCSHSWRRLGRHSRHMSLATP